MGFWILLYKKAAEPVLINKILSRKMAGFEIAKLRIHLMLIFL